MCKCINVTKSNFKDFKGNFIDFLGLFCCFIYKWKITNKFAMVTIRY